MRLLKNGIKSILSLLGYSIFRIGAYEESTSLEKASEWPPPQRRSFLDAIEAIYARQHEICTVIDVGASNGMWSALLMDRYPDSNYLLVEAQPVHEAALQAFCHEHPNAQYVLSAAGETRGWINFLADNPFGGKASPTPFNENNIEVPMTTIDHEVRTKQLAGPYLIKLDTHGFEVPILSGARKTITLTEVLVIECYNFRISSECELFYEMCTHMAELGFRCIDLVDPLYRPRDSSLWQMDLVFVKNDRPEFKYLGYE